MYTALLIMLAGILLGRLFRSWLSIRIIRKLIMASILLLLFLLGVSIGNNKEILYNLPFIGLNSLILMIFCVAGSIAASAAISPLLRKYFFAPAKDKGGEKRRG